MKHIMKRVLALSLVAVQAMAFADTNNRMFYTARPHLSNMPMTLSTFFSATNQDNPGFGGAFQATAFYEQSTDAAKAGKFFSFTDKNNFKIQGLAGANILNTAAADADALPGNFALDTAYNGKITFNPKRTSYGVHLNYQQDLTNVLENLYMTAAAPVVTVEHSMGMKEEATAGVIKFADVMAGGRLTSDFSEPVKYAKINGTQRVTGLADAQLGLGYRFMNSDRFRLQGEVHATVPTGANPTGTKMFEATVGNNGHWALGAGLGGRMNVWQNQENEDNRLSVWVNADLKYLFENNQVRTLGLKDKAGAQFARMRQQDPANALNVLANSVPGVNAMSRAVRVTPGVLAEGMVWGDYTWNAWKFGAGYNVFGRQAETVKLAGKLADSGTYGLTAPLVAVGTQAAAVNGANFMGYTGINGMNLAVPVVPAGAAIDVPANGGAALVALSGNGAAGHTAIQNNSYFHVTQQISAGPATGGAFAGGAVATAIAGGVDSTSTIKQNGVGGAAQVVTDGAFIADANLDMLAQKSAISHKIAGQVSYSLNTDNPSYLGLGGGYEFAGSNDLMSGFQIWAKFGITF